MLTAIRACYLLMSIMLMQTAYAKSGQWSDYATYCIQSGGTVEYMSAEFSTHSGKVLGLTHSFCTFNVDKGFVAIGLETFASNAPSIGATLIKKLGEFGPDCPLMKGNASNPSYNVCLNLGGSAIGFTTNGSFTNPLGESDICVFGDGSMVSGWSLIYMANHREGYDSIKMKVKAEPLNIELPCST